MLPVQPSSQRVFSNTRDSSDLEALIIEARELKRLTQERRPPRCADEMADLAANFLRPQVLDPFRCCRQSFLLKAGALIERVLDGKMVNYPRDFLKEILAGLEYLNSPLVPNVFSKFYQPWSEELIHGCEMSLKFSQTYDLVAGAMSQINPELKPKMEKLTALLGAYGHLRDFLAEQPAVFSPSLEAVLLEFDRAWWEYMYLYYKPQEQPQIELDSSMQQSLRETFARKELIEQAHKLEDDMEDLAETFTELFDTCVSKICPEVFPERAAISEGRILSLLEGLEKPVDYSAYRGRLKAFVLDHFDVVFQSVEELNETTEFYITDVHNSIGHRALYTAFVHLFATKKSVVAIEEAPGLCKAKEGFHSIWMKTDARIIGWDLKWTESLPDIDLELSTRKFDLAYYKMIGAILDPHYRRDKKKLINNFLHVSRSGQQFEKVQEVVEQLRAAIPKTFQARNRQMIQTTREEAPKADRFILIGGEAHLKKVGDDPRMDVQEVHDFLKERRAVILRPKEAKVQEANAPYQMFLLSLQFTI